MCDVLQLLWDYTSVALVHSTDTYGSGGANAFSDKAYSSGLRVIITARFSNGAADFTQQQRALLQSKARVVVLLCQERDS
eukprot:5778038-Prymnesium_polylepis.1